MTATADSQDFGVPDMTATTDSQDFGVPPGRIKNVDRIHVSPQLSTPLCPQENLDARARQEVTEPCAWIVFYRNVG